MKRIACAVAGLVVLGTAAASAQPGWGPDRGYWGRDRGPAFEDDRPFWGPVRPRRIARIVASLGLDPVGPPSRHGAFVVQPAAAEDGRAVRVTINIETGDIVSVTPVTAAPNGRVYGAQPAPGPYARIAPDDDDEYAPPGPGGRYRADLPPPDPYPPNVIEAPKPGAKSAKGRGEKSAKANPDRAPVPRKRPENAQSATKGEPGLVTPLPANPAPAPAPDTPPAPNDMPPVAPLE